MKNVLMPCMSGDFGAKAEGHSAKNVHLYAIVRFLCVSSLSTQPNSPNEQARI